MYKCCLSKLHITTLSSRWMIEKRLLIQHSPLYFALEKLFVFTDMLYYDSEFIVCVWDIVFRFNLVLSAPPSHLLFETFSDHFISPLWCLPLRYLFLLPCFTAPPDLWSVFEKLFLDSTWFFPLPIAVGVWEIVPSIFTVLKLVLEILIVFATILYYNTKFIVCVGEIVFWFNLALSIHPSH